MFDFLFIAAKGGAPLAEEVTAQFKGRVIAGASFPCARAEWAENAARSRFFLYCTGGGSAAERHVGRDGGALRFFDGMVFQNECVNDIRRLRPLLNGADSHEGVFGRYIYGEITEAGACHIHRDVLGYEPLFLGFAPGFTACSNNPMLAAQAVHGAAWRSRKNVRAAGQTATLGAISDLTTGYEEVFFAPQNAGVLFAAGDNAASFYALVPSLYYPMGQDEWEARLEACRAECVRLVAAGNITGGNITGGYDSRVMLALAVEAGVHRDITFSVRGFADHPDVLAAKQIAAHYGLRLRHDEIAAGDVAVPKEDLDRVLAGALQRQFKQAGMREFKEDLMNAAYWGGLNSNRITAAAGTTPAVTAPYKMGLTGIANEEFRGYQSTPHLLNKNIPNKIMDEGDRESLIKHHINKSVLAPAAYTYMHAVLDNHFKTYEDLYSWDLWYHRTRNPQFAGGMSNREGFGIGMNPWLHRLAMIEPPELRAGGRMVFRLIEASAPDLLLFPFAEKTWHPFAYTGTKYEEALRRVGPLVNAARKPLPSAARSAAYAAFLLDNFRLSGRLGEWYSEQYLEALAAEAKKAIAEQDVFRPALARLTTVFGVSLFLENRDAPFEQTVEAEALRVSSEVPLLYSPPPLCEWNAEETCRAGVLQVSREMVFRAAHHNRLSPADGAFVPALKMELGAEAGRLREENGRLKAEAGRLKAEAERLRAENGRLAKAPPARPKPPAGCSSAEKALFYLACDRAVFKRKARERLERRPALLAACRLAWRFLRACKRGFRRRG